MVYSTSTTLSEHIYVYGNITIDSGVTITENGHYMYATGTFDNLGTITGGSNPNADTSGYSITTSYAGSGGGGGGGADGSAGDSGGSTLVAGGAGGSSNPSSGNPGSAGSTPSAPTMSQSLTESMFANVTKYLSSASGGSGCEHNKMDRELLECLAYLQNLLEPQMLEYLL